jgi:two-component system, chemotaxis family, sensor kinase CheA
VIRDPLTHMIRNAIDHGIETPDERRALGKPETGWVRITARHMAGHVTIEVADDGRGLDVASIRERAFALGLGARDALAHLPESEVCRFVFAPGFTTAQRVTNISGRGVGLDIVRANIEEIGGSISLTSRAGHGARILLRIPLTLAIVPALIIDSGLDRFALAQHAVEEIIEIDKRDDIRIAELQGVRVLRLGEDIVPTGELRKMTQGIAGPAAERSEIRLALRIRTGARSFAILVDDIADVQEIVLKPLPSQLDDLSLFSGSTILGDGSVVLVLDPSGLGAALGMPKADGARVNPQLEARSPPARTKLLLFRDGDGATKALPLAIVSRIQSLSAREIQMADGAAVARINNVLVPLLRVGRTRVDAMPDRPLALLMLQESQEVIGLAVDEIVDIVDEELKLEIGGATEGVLGVAIIRGKATEVLDAFHYIDAASRSRRAPTRPTRRMKVLVVDGSEFFRETMGRMLHDAGHGADGAATSAEALAALALSQGYEALLIDLELASRGEGELARQINLASPRQKLALIGVTDHADAATLARARAAGLLGIVGRFDRAAVASALASVGAGRAPEGVAA